MQPRPLSEGNRFQRWYHAWAAPYYARMESPAREQAELVDRFLYSRRGLGVWLGLGLAAVGSTFGLVGAGLPPGWALTGSLLFWFFVPLMGLAVWMMPAAFVRRRSLQRVLMLIASGALTGGLLGFVVGSVVRHGRLDPALLWDALWTKAPWFVPSVIAAGAAFAALLWGAARVRQQVLEAELERARLLQERDAAARQAVEARLRLLQGQIQPHFLFNTLAALQHWVDTGDVRAAPMLRSLTAFLRGSTELLGREEVALGDEADTLAHYLSIQQSRLGDRLAWRIDIDGALRTRALPPGLLLTLVENAFEHGVSPALGGGRVDVRARVDGQHWHLDVSNTGLPLPPSWTEGVGLSNCRQRLQHRFGNAAGLTLNATADGTVATLTLPLDEGARHVA